MSAPQEQPLADLTVEQQDWLRYWKEARAAAEPFEKRAVEYHKAGVEFSKLLVTNLFVLNAGGLVAIPALTAFLGIGALPPADRGFVVGLAAAGFGSGLLFAALCALVTYKNYHTFVSGCELERNRALFDVNWLLKRNGRTLEESQKERDEIGTQLAAVEKKIGRTYVAGHVFGWLSIMAFTASSVWLATRLR
ncbi:hypothetical protein AB4099_18925 [Bosea sp. 2KB_26]|uniref:hypothetical protein n=1 Tax=Bosea sp. 2KB_26 TaxID=3237475 RepID=UPI003F900BBB